MLHGGAYVGDGTLGAKADVGRSLDLICPWKLKLRRNCTGLDVIFEHAKSTFVVHPDERCHHASQEEEEEWEPALHGPDHLRSPVLLFECESDVGL